MNDPLCLLMCGPIGSGKSTFAREASHRGYLIVNDDSIVTMLHSINNLYDKSLKPLYKSIEKNIIKDIIKHRRSLILDRPNYKRSQRIKYIKLLNKLGVDTDIVLFEWPEPIVSAQSRFLSDSRGYSLDHWINAAYHHYDNYEVPHQSLEGYRRLIEIKDFLWDDFEQKAF